MIFNLYKHRGETPLECLQRFRLKLIEEKSEEAAQDKWTYLGRLDPMAEGVLLIGNGEDVSEKRRDDFLHLDKEYEFTALFGFATDTYDILGKVLRAEKVQEEDISESVLFRLVKTYEGKREQKYPLYSSKVQQWNHRDRDEESEEIPSKDIEIKKLEFLGVQELSAKELLGRLLMDIGKVKGDFRQAETLILWKTMLQGFIESEAKIFVGKFRAEVGSGTYIRSIVNDLGNSLGVGASALSIIRIRVGGFTIEESVR